MITWSMCILAFCRINFITPPAGTAVDIGAGAATVGAAAGAGAVGAAAGAGAASGFFNVNFNTFFSSAIYFTSY
jgi:hypothetical protein